MYFFTIFSGDKYPQASDYMYIYFVTTIKI